MTEEQKNAIEHAQKILRAVKLYDLAARLEDAESAASPKHQQDMIARREKQIIADEIAAAKDPTEKELQEARCKELQQRVGEAIENERKRLKDQGIID
jgi:hypothetical protein